MAAPVLVEPKLDAGRDLLRVLDEMDIQPFAAFWLWDPEVEEWQLVIGSDVVDQAGPSAALAKILQALRGRFPSALSGPIELREILVVGRRDRRLDFLRGVPRSGRAGFGQPVRLERAAAGGQFIDDAWIYRNNTGAGSLVDARVVSVSDHSILVEWRTNATLEVRVSLFQGDRLVQGPVAVQSMGRGFRGGSAPAKLFEGLDPSTTYRVVLETEDDRRELPVTTRGAT